MNLFILTLSITLFITACGKQERIIPAQERIYKTTYSNSPLFLELQNSNCSQKIFQATEILFDLHLFLQGTEATQVENFAELVSGLNLKNGNVISRTLHGEKVETFENRAFLREAARELRLCPDESEYYPETIESAALNAAFYINKTFKNFTSVINDLKISPITLNISPEIQRSFLSFDHFGETVKQSSYMTDNAFYMPSNHSITFLPHSQGVMGSSLNVNFWEIPMVASHEYGHHLFEMIYQSNGNNVSNSHGCFNTDATKPKSTRKSIEARVVKVQDVVNAYNEGFADLISYYTLSPREREVTGIKCLQVTRDVTSPILKNGKPKNFNEEVLDSFFSRFDTTTFSSCDYPSFQEVHVMGAIFAHNAETLMSEFTDSNKEKLKIIVKWTRTLKEEVLSHSNASPREFLNKTLSRFVRLTLETFSKEADRKTCKKINRIYPELNFEECNF